MHVDVFDAADLPRDVVVASNAPGTRRVGRWTGTAGASGFPAVEHGTHSTMTTQFV